MLTIRLFGTPTFLLKDQLITHLVTGRTAALLAYLAVTGQPQPRALLTDLLWENIPEQQARTNLRYLLSNLRKAAGDYVMAQGESVAFNQELPQWVDVTAFTTYMGKAATVVPASLEPEILQELLNLYTGEFLSGFPTEGVPIFEHWLLSQRRHLHNLLVQRLRLRTQQHLTQGEYAEGLAINHYLLTLEPSGTAWTTRSPPSTSCGRARPIRRGRWPTPRTPENRGDLCAEWCSGSSLSRLFRRPEESLMRRYSSAS